CATDSTSSFSASSSVNTTACSSGQYATALRAATSTTVGITCASVPTIPAGYVEINACMSKSDYSLMIKPNCSSKNEIVYTMLVKQ
ncbi:MAG: hypothetical protein ACOYK4_06195, partial [Candidatus Planktophila sp.]